MADRHVYKAEDNEVVFKSVSGLNPKGWSKDPFKLLNELKKPDGYEIREEGQLSQRRNPEAGRIR